MQQMSSDSLFLVMFADTALKLDKVGPTFSSNNNKQQQQQQQILLKMGK